MIKNKKFLTVTLAGIIGLTGLGGGAVANAATLDATTSKDFIVNIVEPELGMSFEAERYNIDVVPSVGSNSVDYTIKNTGNISQKYSVHVEAEGLELKTTSVAGSEMSTEDKQDGDVRGYVSVNDDTLGYLEKKDKQIGKYFLPREDHKGNITFEVSKDTDFGNYSLGVVVKAESQNLE